MRETKSICTGCARGCNILISSRENKIYRQTPRENNEVNSAWMCDSGRMHYHTLEAKRRLTDPMIKSGKSHEVIDWPTAILKATRGLSKFSGEEIAIIGSAGMTNEELFLLKTLSSTLDAGIVDVVKVEGEGDEYLSHKDKRPNTNGAKAILKLRNPGSKINTIKKRIKDGEIKALLVYGENVIKHGIDKETLKNLKFLVCSHIQANSLAEFSNVIFPGSGYAEKRGSMINATGRLQVLNKAIEPPGQSREDWEILQDLNRSLDGKDQITEIADLFSEMANQVSIIKQKTLSSIGDLGVNVVETGETVPLLEREAKRVREGLIVG